MYHNGAITHRDRYLTGCVIMPGSSAQALAGEIE